jgi:hypothetical protein
VIVPKLIHFLAIKRFYDGPDQVFTIKMYSFELLDTIVATFGITGFMLPAILYILKNQDGKNKKSTLTQSVKSKDKKSNKEKALDPIDFTIRILRANINDAVGKIIVFTHSGNKYFAKGLYVNASEKLVIEQLPGYEWPDANDFKNGSRPGISVGKTNLSDRIRIRP